MRNALIDTRNGRKVADFKGADLRDICRDRIDYLNRKRIPRPDWGSFQLRDIEQYRV